MKHLTEQLQKIDNSFRFINGGGCGEFALALGEKFRQNNIKFKYVMLDNRRGGVLSNVRNFNKLERKNSLNCINNEGYSVHHIMIYVRGQYIDSTGVYSSLDESEWGYCTITAILKEEILESWCRNGGWNNLFRRGDIPEIKEMINNLAL